MTSTTESLATGVHGYGTLASRPAAAVAGRTYYATDTLITYRDNGTSWNTESGPAAPTLTVREADSSPTDAAVTEIVFPNGTLGIASHVVTYTPAAAAIAIQEEDGSPSGTLSTLKVPNGSLIDNGSGSFSVRDVPVGSVGCRLSNTIAQSVPNATSTALTFNTEEYDTDSFHSTSSNTSRITIPAGLGGKYLLIGHSYHQGSVGGDPQIFFTKNGVANIIEGTEAYFPKADSALIISVVVELAASDYVELAGYNNAGASRDFGYPSTGERNTFTAHRLDAGKVGVGVGARVNSSATQTAADSTSVPMTFNTEDFDTDSFHSTSSNTSRMTIPAGLGGKYLVQGYVYWDSNASGVRILRFLKNGTAQSPQVVDAAVGGLGQEIMSIFDLAAGDYIELGVYQTSGSTRTTGDATNPEQRNMLSIMRIDALPAGTVQAGTAFPSGPATSTRYFRTDLGMEFFYDGTRWLSSQIYHMTFAFHNAAEPITAAGTMYAPTPVPITTDIWLIGFHVAVVVTGTNDASNYWTITADGFSGFTTIADGANALVTHYIAVGSSQPIANNWFTITHLKTGNPAALYSPVVYAYRYIGT